MTDTLRVTSFYLCHVFGRYWLTSRCPSIHNKLIIIAGNESLYLHFVYSHHQHHHHHRCWHQFPFIIKLNYFQLQTIHNYRFSSFLARVSIKMYNESIRFLFWRQTLIKFACLLLCKLITKCFLDHFEHQNGHNNQLCICSTLETLSDVTLPSKNAMHTFLLYIFFSSRFVFSFHSLVSISMGFCSIFSGYRQYYCENCFTRPLNFGSFRLIFFSLIIYRSERTLEYSISHLIQLIIDVFENLIT